ncbi:MAG: NRDE family protein, partial [Proteobacteria bacterium]|nr:NRDE family protein [Pseudomonadota bacterium]
GLSNQILDCDWPKVVDGRARLTEIVSTVDEPSEALFSLLLGQGDDRKFSNSFIAADTYGTRAATVVLIGTGGDVIFEERNFGANGAPAASNRYQFNCDDDS